MMKAVLSFVCAALCGAAICAEAASAKDDEALKKKREETRRRQYLRNGGRVFKEGEGKIVLWNAQKKFPSESISKELKRLNRSLGFAVVLEDNKPPMTIAEAGDLLKASGGKVAVFIVDDKTLPPLLAAPESNWAIVNFANIDSDKAVASVVETRVQCEIWRGVAYACGAGDCPQDSCSMGPVCSFADFMNFTTPEFCPHPMSGVDKRLRKIGMTRRYGTTYRHACQEGWAPAPTNSVQKAIWDEVHALPSEPIKIKPETKKVTE